MNKRIWSVGAVAFAAMFSSSILAADPVKLSVKDEPVAEVVSTIEFFQGMDEGKIEVEFYPKNATQATVVIKNKTNEPLDIELPRTFGAVHVLGQLGGGMGMGGMGGMGGGMGMGGMGGGMGGMFRVKPDKARRFEVPCVCLEHGKKDPNPRMKYRIVPIERVNGDPRVARLCELLGHGKIPQNTAQAAAWHLANGLTWEQLAHKNRVESKYTGNIRFFNPIELRNAFQVSALINAEYEQLAANEESSGYSDQSLADDDYSEAN